MGQIIDLLSKLFNLTKVASVTLPGLAAAGALALLFWLPPVDVIPIAELDFSQGTESGANQSSAKVPYEILQQLPCPTVPGSQGETCLKAASDSTSKPACSIIQFRLRELLDCDQCSDQKSQPNAQSGLKTNQEILRKAGLDSSLLLPDPDTGESASYIRDARARQQYLLDFEKDAFARCSEVEDSWRGTEEQENVLLAADITNLEKQRSDLQDAYTGLLKANNPGTGRIREELSRTLGEVERVRERSLKNSSSIRERERRSAELKRNGAIISDRLTDPERLRPRKTIDDFLSGLVNHVVAFILLSLALSLIITAINRAIFDSINEILFTNLMDRGLPVWWKSFVTVLTFLVILSSLGIVLYTLIWILCGMASAWISAFGEVAKLAAAVVIGLAGLGASIWWIARGNLKKEDGKTSATSDPGKLGFFNRRLQMRDSRLLLGPTELRSKVKEERMQRIAAVGKPADQDEPQTPPPDVLQPRYAIGKGIITAEEYQTLKDNYLAQSDLSLGLIVPVVLLVVAIGKHHLQWCSPLWMFPLLLFLEFFLIVGFFWVGTERHEKFGMEFRLLILGHWDKLNELAAQTKPTKPTIPDLGKQISDALSKMQMQVTPLVVRLQNEPAPSTPTTTSAASSGPLPPGKASSAKPAKPQGGAPDESTTDQK